MRLRLGRQRLGRKLRAQHAGLRLVEQELEVVAAEAREQPGALVDAEALDGDVLRAHGRL